MRRVRRAIGPIRGAARDDRLAERPHQATELVAALLPQDLPGAQGQGIGPVLDLLAQGGAASVKAPSSPTRPRALRRRDDACQASSSQPRDVWSARAAPPRTRRGRRGPRCRRARRRRGRRGGRRRGTRGAARWRATAEVRRLGHGQARLAGVQRPARRRHPRAAARASSRPGRLGLSTPRRPGRAAAAASAAPSRASSSTGRCGDLPCSAGWRGGRGSGLKLKKVAITTSAGHAAHRGRPRGEVPVDARAPRAPRTRVASGAK